MARTEKQQQDPTGQARNRRKALNEINARLAIARRASVAAFRQIPRKRRQKVDIVNNRVYYEYDITATQLAELNELIAAGMDTALETEGDKAPVGWFWEDRIEQPYRQGTIRAASTLERDVTAAVAIGLLSEPLFGPSLADIQALLLSRPYLNDLAAHVDDGFRSIKGLSDDTARQVFGVISRGVQAGLTPTEIVDDIVKRFDVASSSAKRIANTEINRAFTDAKMRLGRQVGEQYNVRTALMHISALLPTTRDHHAARHGNVYTYEAQMQWWNSGANRINCYCDVDPVIVDRAGQPLNQQLQDELKAERKFWQEQEAA